MSGLGRGFLVGAAIAVPLMQPGVPDALLDRAEFSPGVEESTISLVENVGEAVQEGVEGARKGEDAAEAEQVPEADYSDTSPPPPGSTWEATTPEPLPDEGPAPAAAEAAGTPEPLADWDAQPEPATPEPTTAETTTPEPSPGPEVVEPEPEPEVS